ncbi:iron-siderophore ABC transporter substrate-binding protein, partial [Mycobacterium avium subsp. hominissuis]|nr:iron-siderophore ABC transporter substrate-binding protein [Mycobacterium avium subsp. hominissuis]
MLFGVIRPARLAAVTAALVVACGGCGSDRPAATTTRSLVTPTTQIAGAGVLGNDRRPDESCARDAAEADPGPAKRQVHNAPGGDPAPVQVSADPRRIVVLAGDQLDALCALGLQSRVVGAALPDGASGQPAYLGGAVRGVPGVGSRSHPDVKAIAAAHPDLILGSQGLTPALYPQL